jgi:hypothetical protein
MDIALREHAAVMHQENVRRERFYFVKDVARNDHVASLGGPVSQQADRLTPRQRVHSGQRLVEDQQFGRMGDGLRQLHTLPHALAVGADALVCGIVQVHLLQGAECRVGCLTFAQTLKPQQ